MMYELECEELGSILSREDPEGVEFFILGDDGPYRGEDSHREAVLFAMRKYEERWIDECISWYEGDASKIPPIVFDIEKAKAKSMDPEELLFVPEIVRTDYNGTRFYNRDTNWENDGQGDHIPYWYAFLEPPHGTVYGPKDLAKVDAVLFPGAAEDLEAFEWTTDWSDYFDDGHEWWGAGCWSVYDRKLGRYIVLLSSATD